MKFKEFAAKLLLEKDLYNSPTKLFKKYKIDVITQKRFFKKWNSDSFTYALLDLAANWPDDQLDN